MALLTANGHSVAHCTLDLPEVGRWTAEMLVVASTRTSPIQDNQAVELEFENGETYRGTCVRSGSAEGYWRIEVVAGKDGVSKPIPSKFYEDIPRATVLRDLLKVAGEEPGEIDAPGNFPRWTRFAGNAYEAIKAIMQRLPGRSWRVQPDGKVWVGQSTWEAAPEPLTLLEHYADEGRSVCSLDSRVMPGMTVTMSRGREQFKVRTGQVTHVVIEDEIHTEVRVATTSEADSPLALVALQALRHTDFHGIYIGQVLVDHGDHTVDVEMNDPRLPQMVKVPLYVRLPGVQIKIKPGSPILVSFEEADPSRPFVEVRELGTLQYLKVTDEAGDFLEMDKEAKKITVSARLEVLVVADTKVNVMAASEATVDAPLVKIAPGGEVQLAGGGPAVARVGDPVRVTIATGSSAGVHTGTITAGSAKVKSG